MHYQQIVFFLKKAIDKRQHIVYTYCSTQFVDINKEKEKPTEVGCAQNGDLGFVKSKNNS